jgi:hypothetical protein
VSTGFLHSLRGEEPALRGLPEAAIRAEAQRLFERQSDNGPFDATVGALLRLSDSRDDPLLAASRLLAVAQFIGTTGQS